MCKPKIRFKGCQGEWERKELGYIARKVSEKNTQGGYKETFTNSAELGIISQLDYFDHDITNKANIAGYYVVQPDDFVYNPRISVTAPVGPISRNKLGRCGIMSPLYTVFHFEGIDNGFMEYYFKTTVWHSFMYQEGNTGARNDRFSIKDSVFFTMPILLPSSLPEQRQIAAYFRSLDGILSGCESRLSSLRRLKEGALQAFFPQQGETQPRIRFKGCKGEWERKKAKDIFTTFDERKRPDLPVLSAYQDIRGMAIRSESGYDISHDHSNEITYKHVLPGQFVIHLRSFQGGFAHSSVEGITSPAYTVFGFEDAERHDDYYWKYIFMSKTFINRLKLITYGIRDGRSISFTDFGDFEFVVPTLPEQRQIANFFRTLDRRIELERQRLEKLKQLKAACLEKMFV